MRIRSLVLCTVLFVISVLLLFVINRETENEASKIPERASLSERLCKLYDGVETFVMFIGYPRSSHSLVGALLDAHPEIIIPHEYDLMSKWKNYQSSDLKQKNLQKCALFYDLHHFSMEQSKSGFRSNTSNIPKYYTYYVPGLWQGRCQTRIKVIGDKKGGETAVQLMDPRKMKVLEEIHHVVQVPMKFIHVIRNPFDNIATLMLHKTHSRGKVRKEGGLKIKNKTVLDDQINKYFGMAAANQRVRERYGDAVIDIPGHDTVLRPKETLLRLCDHLRVTCSEDYIKKCSKILYGSPTVTRNNVVWTEEQKGRVTEMMKDYPFLKQFSFDEYPK